jgi:hypothetical protein
MVTSSATRYGVAQIRRSAGVAALAQMKDCACPMEQLGYAHISCRMRIGLGKPLRAYDAVRFGALRQLENTNRNGLVAWIIRGCPAR